MKRNFSFSLFTFLFLFIEIFCFCVQVFSGDTLRLENHVSAVFLASLSEALLCLLLYRKLFSTLSGLLLIGTRDSRELNYKRTNG